MSERNLKEIDAITKIAKALELLGPSRVKIAIGKDSHRRSRFSTEQVIEVGFDQSDFSIDEKLTCTCPECGEEFDQDESIDLFVARDTRESSENIVDFVYSIEFLLEKIIKGKNKARSMIILDQIISRSKNALESALEEIEELESSIPKPEDLICMPSWFPMEDLQRATNKSLKERLKAKRENLELYEV